MHKSAVGLLSDLAKFWSYSILKFRKISMEDSVPACGSIHLLIHLVKTNKEDWVDGANY